MSSDGEESKRALSNIFMTGSSLAHHHKKGHDPPPTATVDVVLREEEEEDAENDGGGDIGSSDPPIGVTFYDLEGLIHNDNIDGDDEEPPPAAMTFHDLEQFVGLRGGGVEDASSSEAAAADNAGVLHGKYSVEKNHNDPPPPAPAPAPLRAPPAPPKEPTVPLTFHNLRGDGGTSASNVAIKNTGKQHDKNSKEKNYGDPAPPPKAPPAPAPADVLGALRGDGDVSDINFDTAGLHNKYSPEKDYGDRIPPPPAPPKAPPAPLANLRGDEDASNVAIDSSSLHDKNPEEKDYVPPTPKPAPSIPKPVVFESLRDQHQSFNVDTDTSSIHGKYSLEQNAKNPEEQVIWQWEDPSGGEASGSQGGTTPTTAPTLVDVRRVNPAPDNVSLFDSGGCKPADGAYFGNGRDARNGGVVLRYQYELHAIGESGKRRLDSIYSGMGDKIGTNEGGEEEEGTTYLVSDILPALEEGIIDSLIPVFFDGCQDVHHVGGGGRGLKERGSAMDRRQGGDRRRLSEVVGIDAEPIDIPLRQQPCESEFVSSDPHQAAQCHRIEGGLTLYFPPNSSVHSSILSSATLTTLRAIERGMSDGVLKSSHPSIRKLHFLESSYGLQPVDYPEGGVPSQGEPGSSNGSGEGDPQGGSANLGLILGIVVPLVVLCCCCLGFGLYRRLRRNDPDNDGTVEDDSFSSDGDKVQAKGIGNGSRAVPSRLRNPQEDSTDSGTDSDHDEEDFGSGTDYDEENREDSGTEYSEEEDVESDTDYDGDRGAAAAADCSFDEISSGSVSSGARDYDESLDENSSEDGNAVSGKCEPVADEEYKNPREENHNLSAPSFNPLDPVFEEAARVRAEKREGGGGGSARADARRKGLTEMMRMAFSGAGVGWGMKNALDGGFGSARALQRNVALRRISLVV
eukprot:CAMPEP_0172540034 /NCGR_PEP_ID=MMETSP1067-20121228/11115_1 /TAXON_ID=265564 ORGANISM="Thalassiosira punctigera, Strain Tpunct2005C2" /NCGR_SAMPLE_ID=MMETSP1067 /ASSEMBLY_ACC=CAM_ASM_000444 /LENGTH=908 /DNA_ID=CAMNT_0013325809 /DNA_START=119 /DNA_END=2846 /DNA_ORIENTATION=-